MPQKRHHPFTVRGLDGGRARPGATYAVEVRIVAADGRRLGAAILTYFTGSGPTGGREEAERLAMKLNIAWDVFHGWVPAPGNPDQAIEFAKAGDVARNRK